MCSLGNSTPLNLLIFFEPSLCTFTPDFVRAVSFSVQTHWKIHAAAPSLPGIPKEPFPPKQAYIRIRNHHLPGTHSSTYTSISSNRFRRIPRRYGGTFFPSGKYPSPRSWDRVHRKSAAPSPIASN